MSEKRFVPVGIAADRIGVSKQAVWRMIEDGRIPETEVIRIKPTKIAADIVEEIAAKKEREELLRERINDLRDKLRNTVNEPFSG